jgi:WD40 repeat protein/DNA-binding SARP family transcriptional activator
MYRGNPVPGLESAKGQALLAYLALESDRPHSRESLATLLWSQASQAAALQSLRQALYNLRQVLALPDLEGSDSAIDSRFLLITRQHVSFRLVPRVSLDVAAFTALLDACQVHEHRRLDACAECLVRLEQAAALYHGDLLADLTLPDAEVFEEWRLFSAEMLRRRVLEALTALAAYHERRREYGQATYYLQRQLGLAPWREEAYAQLMRVLALDGQRSEALNQFEACRRVLALEFGVHPGAEIESLYESIRAGNLQPDSVWLQNPYRGLYAFTEADAADFYGRETYIERLLSAVARQSIVVIIGASGSGKSSLIQAGLLPRLRTGRGKTASWLTATLRPGEAPFSALAEALAPLLPRTPDLQAFAETLCQHRFVLGEVVGGILQVHAPGTRLLLVVDQFEELYTLVKDAADGRLFLESLLAPNHPSGLMTLLALRADFMSQALSTRPLADAIQRGGLLLGPMNRDELRRVIEEPARNRGVVCEPGLVERLLDDVGDEPGKLPLLEFALMQLWERRELLRLTHVAYDLIGGVAGALTRYAEHFYIRLSEQEQANARRIFLRLIRPGEGTEDTRRIAARVEFDAQDWQLVQNLSQARLVVTSHDPKRGHEVVEIVHEALIRHWARLRDGLAEDREFHAWHERLQVPLAAWADSACDDRALLTGLSLTQSERWYIERLHDLSTVEREFLSASLAARDRLRAETEERAQREMTQARALAEAVENARRARLSADRATTIAQSLSLTTGAQLALMQGKPDLALALALAANHMDNLPPYAELVLADAAYAHGTHWLLLGHEGAVHGVAVSPSGSEVFSASADRSLILWDSEQGTLIRRFLGHDDVVTSVSFLPDGQTAISGSADCTLVRWDLASGRILRRFIGHHGAIHAVAVSPDGLFALSASADQSLILWDIESGRVIRRLAGHEAGVLSVAITATGRTALSGSADRSVIHWDLAAGGILRRLAGQGNGATPCDAPRGHSNSVCAVAFSGVDETAISASLDEHIILWNLATGESKRCYRSPGGSILALAVDPDGPAALQGLVDGRVAELNLNTGKTRFQSEGHTGRVLSVSYAPGARWAVSGSADGTVRVWHVQSGAELRRIEDPDFGLGLDLNRDGGTGLVVGQEGGVWLWDYTSARMLRPLLGPGQATCSYACFSSDGSQVISAAGEVLGASLIDHTIRVLDVAAGMELQRLDGHTGRIWDIAISPAGGHAASGSEDGTVRIWDLAHRAGRVLSDVSPQGVRSLAYSPDGEMLLVGLERGQSDAPDFSLRLLEVTTGQEIRRFAGHREAVQSVAFSPNGWYAVSCAADESVSLWDVRAGQLLRRFTWHASSVLCAVFSHDSQLLASGDQGGQILLWDVRRERLLRRFLGHDDAVTGLLFTSNDRTLLSVSRDGTLREWRVDASLTALKKWITAARYIPELTSEQRVQYHLEPMDDRS